MNNERMQVNLEPITTTTNIYFTTTTQSSDVYAFL